MPPDLGCMPSKWVLSGSTKPFQEGFPSMCHIFPSRSSVAALFKTVSMPSGLQVPMPFKTFGLCLRSTSCGNHSGACLCSVACPRGGRLALCLASTVCGFGTLMLPILTPNSSQPNMAGALPCLTSPASSGSSVMQSGGFKRMGCCVTSRCLGSMPQASSCVQGYWVAAPQGSKMKMKGFFFGGATSPTASAAGTSTGTDSLDILAFLHNLVDNMHAVHYHSPAMRTASPLHMPMGR